MPTGLMQRIASLGVASAVALLAACSTAPVASAPTLVDAGDLVPGLRLDIRYAGDDNFVGEPVRGYEAPKCLLLPPAAEALAAIARDLQREGYALQVFDCYRPQRAVRHFVEWAGAPDDATRKQRHYPDVDKSALLGTYIAETSGHSRGLTVDLTLARCDAAACTPIDMGTPFDFFDERAHTDSPRIAPAQRANRERLRAAMARHGFRNYAYEWWHYTLDRGPSQPPLLDVPVR
ncbi:MAG TPA: M15 family metallopeptidase [Lysobacter sp.]|nr:M15 family metallopeptidase [Lysobacter sp.]